MIRQYHVVALQAVINHIDAHDLLARSLSADAASITIHVASEELDASITIHVASEELDAWTATLTDVESVDSMTATGLPGAVIETLTGRLPIGVRVTLVVAWRNLDAPAQYVPNGVVDAGGGRMSTTIDIDHAICTQCDVTLCYCEQGVACPNTEDPECGHGRHLCADCRPYCPECRQDYIDDARAGQ